ncbi:MAG: PqqD family protein [Elusimicrobia bacterium]|nr:PqqD family protein [Candidatus Liberimonas magnetica]
MVIKISPHIAYRTIENKAYIINTQTSTLHELDEIGTFLWELLCKAGSAEILSRKLFDTYDIVSYEQAQKDVADFIDELSSKGLILSNK